MAENKIELKSVSELLGMKFFIPSYQRGYRWTKQQVKDLLDDVNEFIQNKNSDFYSLQPLVVKKRWPSEDENVTEEEKQKIKSNWDEIRREKSLESVANIVQKIKDDCPWEVIDVQQRLTTIYIILKYLKFDESYSIDYQTRDGFGDFLKTIQEQTFKSNEINDNFAKLIDEDNDKDFDEIINEAFDSLINDNKGYDNIDFYHIFTSFGTIKYWFEFENKEVDDFKNQLLKKVKFIWYESVDEEPIKVFTRLNIGKIKLTNSELIKALMLNRSNFKDESSRHIQLRQQEIASEWDNIEYTLQNDEFWFFLHNEKYEKPTRIDSIFDLICEDDGLKVFMKQDGDKGLVKDSDKKNNKIGSDEYRIFRYFYEYFHANENRVRYGENNITNTNPETPIEECWKEVKRYFQTFQEWFNDLSLYHYIGYLRCPVKNKENVIEIEELVENWSGDKDHFVSFLKQKITTRIDACKYLDKQYEIGNNPPKTECKPLLLLHNIQTVINQNKELESKKEYGLPVFYKFPFHLYKKEVWNVEHIDSNTPNDLSDKNDQKEWLKCSLLDDGLDNELIEQIKSFLKEENNCPSFNDLSKKIETKSDMKEEEKNKIWNFVLLDENTNKGYGNAIFPAKRRCIIGKDQGKTFVLNDIMIVEEGKGSIAFVPPVTKNVFLKYYNTSVDNLKGWNTTDAKSYKDNIYDTLKEFGVIDNQNTEENVNK